MQRNWQVICAPWQMFCAGAAPPAATSLVLGQLQCSRQAETMGLYPTPVTAHMAEANLQPLLPQRQLLRRQAT